MRDIRIALAGNANVGKSAIFNYLTGMSQHIGNWPGKTVEKAEGSLIFKGRSISLVDLPGVYSLGPDSPEEKIALDYLAEERPDAVLNIVDASVLERNLFLTLQLIRLGLPMVIVVNMDDVARARGIYIDAGKLEKELGVPVVKAVAVHGKGIYEAMGKALGARGRPRKKGATKESIYSKAHAIAMRVQATRKGGVPLDERLDLIALHEVFGYAILLGVLALIFFAIFSVGGWISGGVYWAYDWLEGWMAAVFGSGLVSNALWEGIVGGIVAGIAVALPYVLPFYLVFAVLEDSGYVARMAFLMDGFMHMIGLHGKAFIPLFIGYGCTVPACIGCRIIGSERERFQTAFLATLIPCAARSVIILGLVGAYMGWQWALTVYLFNIGVVMALGKITSKVLPSEPTSFIMEMPSYKLPQAGPVLKRSFARLKAYAYEAFPIIVAMSLIISLIEAGGLAGTVENMLAPITAGWLGLPAVIGIALIFGILRKELAIISLAGLLGTSDFGAALSPLQMLVFTLVMVFYIPCSATIATLAREFGWKRATAITVFEIVFAIALGGIAVRVVGGFIP